MFFASFGGTFHFTNINFKLTSMGKLYPLLLALFLPFISPAQIIWDFSTATPLSGAPAGVSVSAISQGNNNGTTPLLTTTSASSGYVGATGGNNAGAAANIGAFRPDSTPISSGR